MSGDVQPRKRKDKKKKRDSLDRKPEDEIFARKLSLEEDSEEIVKESHHGVHATKMGADDIHLHIHSDHGTGGHWFAKIFFFGLLAVLIGLVGLIIVENRGLSDLDTPLSESRFSEYFEGWVDEHRDSHDDHAADKIVAELEDHDAEPFEEEEDHSEQDEGDAHDEGHEDHDDDHDDHEEASEEAEDNTEEVAQEEEEEDEEETNATEEAEEEVSQEEDEAPADEEDEANTTEENEEDEEEDNQPEPVPQVRSKRSIEEPEDNDEGFGDDEEEENKSAEEDEADAEKSEEDEAGNDEQEEVDDDDDDDNVPVKETDAFEEHDTNNIETKKIVASADVNDTVLVKQDNTRVDSSSNLTEPLTVHIKAEQTKSDLSNSSDKANIVEEDDDFDSLENVVDNDAEETLHLQQKAQQEAQTKVEAPEEEEEEIQSSSLGVKVFVGVALAIVARLVLIKNRPETTSQRNEVFMEPPIDMRRRLTIASPEEPIPSDEEGILDDLEEEEEEIEEEEVEEEVAEGSEDEDEVLKKIKKYVPESFEDLNALYRPKPEPEIPKTPQKEEPKAKIEEIKSKIEEIKPKIEETSKVTQAKPVVLEIKQSVAEVKPKIDPIPTRTIEPKVIASKIEPPKPKVEEKIVPTSSKVLAAAPPPVKDVPAKKPPEPSFKKPEEKEEEENVEYIEEGEEEEESYEEELEDEEEEEEEVSDVDDDDLMKRLEAKYGKLPEKKYDSEEEEEDEEEVDDPSWTRAFPTNFVDEGGSGDDEKDYRTSPLINKVREKRSWEWSVQTEIKPKTGGGPQDFNEDDFEEELRRANEELLQNNLKIALKTFESIALKYPDLPGAVYGKAKTLDRLSEKYQSNQFLTESIEAYKRFLALGELVDDASFKEAAERCINRMRFRGLNLQAVAIHEMLIKRFPEIPSYRNQLAVTYLLVNRLTEAKEVLHKTLLKWRHDGFALVHYGFVLKNLDKNFESAVDFLREGIKSGAEGTQDGRFYFNLGDALQRLGRAEEAMEVYREGAKKNLFLSEYQRSLYNVDPLNSKPFWTKEETTYAYYFNIFEQNWKGIRDEGLTVLNEKGFFLDEAESLKDVGDWKQFELFARGYKNAKNCLKVPFTCKMIETFPAARFCKRGQVKFSVMHPGTHVWPHCGPTNCRLRAHLGLKVPKGTQIRVAKEERTWEEGKFLIFDDSFEHEVWHNGTSLRLVLIIDVWHPDLTEQQKSKLSPI